MEVLFPEDDSSSSKILLLEPNKNSDVELENQQISKFAI